MSVIIGIDPHKALHAACAIDRHEIELAEVAGPQRPAPGGRAVRRGRHRSSVARGRSSPPAGSAICSPSSSSPAASMWSMCRRRCRRGCGCWARDVEQERRQRCPRGRDRSVAVTVVGGGARRGSREGVAAVGQSAARHRHGRGVARAAGCMRLVSELVAGGIRKEIVVTRPNSSSPRSPDDRDTTSTARARPRDSRRDPPPRRATEALQEAHHRRRRRVGDVAHRHLRCRPDHRRVDHRLQRRHRPVPDRRALRRLQRHRPDRVLLRRAHRAPTVTTRQPHLEPRDPHDRRHPDPPPPQRRPRLLRPQDRRRQAPAAKQCAR